MSFDPLCTQMPFLLQAQLQLADKPPGSVVFRPTQRRELAEALSRISATFKLADTPAGGSCAQVEP
jgi:hypothetical protein